MNLVKKFGLTFICCLPVGAVISGYESNSNEEVSGTEEDAGVSLSENKELDIEGHSSISTELKEAKEEEIGQEQNLIIDEIQVSASVENSEITKDAELNGTEDTQLTRIVREESESLAILKLEDTSVNEEKTDVFEEKNTVIGDVKHIEIEENQDFEDSQKSNQLSAVLEPDVSTTIESAKENHSRQLEASELEVEGLKIEPVSKSEESSNNESVSDEKLKELQNKDLSNSDVDSELLPSEEDVGKRKSLEEITEVVQNEESLPANVTEAISISENEIKEESKTPSGLETEISISTATKVAKMETQNTHELAQRLIGEGPVTKEKLKGGLSKLRSKGSLTIVDRKIYVFLMKLLGEIISSKK